jgi:hypothetical protein
MHRYIRGCDFTVRYIRGRDFMHRCIRGRDFPARYIRGRDFPVRYIRGRDFLVRYIRGCDFTAKNSRCHFPVRGCNFTVSYGYIRGCGLFHSNRGSRKDFITWWQSLWGLIGCQSAISHLNTDHHGRFPLILSIGWRRAVLMLFLSLFLHEHMRDCGVHMRKAAATQFHSVQICTCILHQCHY